MLAAVYLGKRNIVVKDVTRPKINSNEVLIRVKAASICGTDRKIYEYGHFKIKNESEVILGHEIAGVIEECGKNIKGYKVGARVVVAPNIGCGECATCKKGLDQLCPDFNAFGVTYAGGFAEYIKITKDAVRRGNIIEIDDNLSFAEAALIEPVSCCYSAWEAMQVSPGNNVLIIGAGPMGNLHLLLHKKLGAGKVFVADNNEKKLAFSRMLGADSILPNDDKITETILDLTSGYGADAVIVASPAPIAQDKALDLAGILGSVSFFAGLPKGVDYSRLRTNLIHYKQLRITGTTGSSVNQFRQTVKIVKELNIDLKQMVTKTVGLEQLPEVFCSDEVFQNNMKIVVEPGFRP